MSKKPKGLGGFQPLDSISEPGSKAAQHRKHTSASRKSGIGTRQPAAQPARNGKEIISVDIESLEQEHKLDEPPKKRRKPNAVGSGMLDAEEKMEIDPQPAALGEVLQHGRRIDEDYQAKKREENEGGAQRPNSHLQHRNISRQGQSKREGKYEITPIGNHQGRGSEGAKSSATTRSVSEDDVLVVKTDDEDIMTVARPRRKHDKNLASTRPSFQVPEDQGDQTLDSDDRIRTKRPTSRDANRPARLMSVPSKSYKGVFLSPEPDGSTRLSATFQRSQADDEKDELANSSPPEINLLAQKSGPSDQIEDSRQLEAPKKGQPRPRSPRIGYSQIPNSSPVRKSRSSSGERRSTEIPKTKFVRSSEQQGNDKKSLPFRQRPSSSKKISLRRYQGGGGKQLDRGHIAVQFDRPQKRVHLKASSSAPRSFGIEAICKYYYSSDGTLFFANERRREDFGLGWHYLIFTTRKDLQTFLEQLRSIDQTIKHSSKSDEAIERIFQNFRSGKAAQVKSNPTTTARSGPTAPLVEDELGRLTKNAARKHGETFQEPAKPRRQKLVDQLRGIPSAKQRNQYRLQEDCSEIKYESEEDAQVRPQVSKSKAMIRKSQISTRSSGRQEKRADPKPVEKFSEKHGLGQPWKRPLLFPKQGPSKATVEFDDLIRLDDEEFLNDNLISFCIRYAQSKSSSVANRVHFFNSFFYESLMKPAKGKKGINYEGVRRWTSKIKLFENYDYIVVPINENLHWYAAIICNLQGLVQSSDSDANEGAQNAEPAAPPGETYSAPNIPLSKPTSGKSHSERSLGKRPESKDPPTVPEEQQDTSISAEKPVPQTRTVHRSSVSPAPVSSEVSGNRSPSQSATKSEVSVRPNNIDKKDKRPRSTIRLRDPIEPLIVTLDSFDMAHGPVVRSLKDYLKAEAQDKLSLDIQEPRGHQGRHIPLQQNFCDCGLYLVGYIAKFLENPAKFITKLVKHEFDWSQDWPHLNPEAMRHNIRDIIMREHQKYELEVISGPKSSPAKMASAEVSDAGESGHNAIENETRTVYQEFTAPRPEPCSSSIVLAGDRKKSESPLQSREQPIRTLGMDPDKENKVSRKSVSRTRQTEEASPRLEPNISRPTRGALKSVRPQQVYQQLSHHSEGMARTDPEESLKVGNEVGNAEQDLMNLDNKTSNQCLNEVPPDSYIQQLEIAAAAPLEQSGDASEAQSMTKHPTDEPQDFPISTVHTPRTLVNGFEHISLEQHSDGPSITAVDTESDADSAITDRYEPSKYFQDIENSQFEYISQQRDNAPRDPEMRMKWAIHQGQAAGAAAKEKSRPKIEGVGDIPLKIKAPSGFEAGQRSKRAEKATSSPARPVTRGKKFSRHSHEPAEV